MEVRADRGEQHLILHEGRTKPQVSNIGVYALTCYAVPAMEFWAAVRVMPSVSSGACVNPSRRTW